MKGGSLDWGLLKRLLPYVRKNLWLFILSLFLMIVSDLLTVLHPYLIKVGIDEHIARGDFPGLLRVAIYLGIVLVGSFISDLLLNFSVEYLGQKFLFQMRMDVVRKVISLGNDYFDKSTTGSVMTNITNDVEAIREFISDGIVTIIGDFLKLGFILGAMLFINVQLALVTFTTIPLFIIVTLIFRTNLRKGYRGVRKANSLINSTLVETITGIKEITLFENKGPSTERFSDHNRTYLTSFLKVVNNFSVFFATFEVISFLGFLVILLFTHFTIGVTVMVGEVFAFYSYLNMFYRPFRQLAEKSNAFQSAMAAAERIFTLLDTEVSIQGPESPVSPPDKRKGDLEFRNVTFGYEEGNPIIADLSFRVAPGEKVAIVGHTGAGKTTIINLVNRLYDIQKGSILVDGIDIRDYSLNGLRTTITTVPQDFFLFSGSFYDNITLNKGGLTREEVEEAARAVKADVFIKDLPLQYETELLEDGKSLSTGQRQLLSFARAFVTDPSILIIDEATSNIDSKTESLIEEALSQLLNGRTALIIAHRLSTIKNVDRILVLHKGKLVEEGSHEHLIGHDGVYARLYRMQTLKTV